MNARTAMFVIAICGCGPGSTTARRLWLDSPMDGVILLQDTEPPPF